MDVNSINTTDASMRTGIRPSAGQPVLLLASLAIPQPSLDPPLSPRTLMHDPFCRLKLPIIHSFAPEGGFCILDDVLDAKCIDKGIAYRHSGTKVEFGVDKVGIVECVEVGEGKEGHFYAYEGVGEAERDVLCVCVWTESGYDVGCD